MTARRLLIANRGEIALRIARAATELGLDTVAIHATDDASSPHCRAADEAVSLDAQGPAAYLDAARVLRVAGATGCTLVHPGYGFLSENAAFAAHCAERGLVFVGPSPEVLALFGDKSRARRFAIEHDVPVAAGTDGETSLDDMRRFMAALRPGARVMIKAVAGGGGRGMRAIEDPSALEAAFARCASEARAAFGHAALYIEQYVADARHIEVQVIGDGAQVAHVGERDCSLQMRHQKVVEIAPAPALDPALRARLVDASLRMARGCGYRGLCTFEFLVASDPSTLPEGFVFIEANPRLQVEHTVTEEVYGVDLVRAQIAIAMGATLAQAGMDQTAIGDPRGCAVQFRLGFDPSADAAAEDTGTIAHLALPSGQGIRVDHFVQAGFAPSRLYDPMLAKLIVRSHAPELSVAMDKGARALRQFRLHGIPTNRAFLEALASDPQVRAGPVTTRFVEHHLERLREAAQGIARAAVAADAGAEGGAAGAVGAGGRAAGPAPAAAGGAHGAGVAHGAGGVATAAARSGASVVGATVNAPPADPLDDSLVAVRSPIRGTVLEMNAAVGARVRRGESLCVLDAMKMEHLVEAPASGVIAEVRAAKGDLLAAGALLIAIDPFDDADETDAAATAAVDGPRGPRRDLLEILEIKRVISDAGRPDAVAKRHASGMRTARENLADLCDEDSFVEYGAFAVAGRTREMTHAQLREISPADGFVYGLATVNAALFGREASRCLVASYDYMVFAGTQGFNNHKKHDRLFQLAEAARRPVVIFTEGGGGRPTEPDNTGGAGLATPTFFRFARLSGLVPLVGVVAGRCFAGNAALLGCCDVIIATRNASVGMGGPVMIEGAGLGVYPAEEVGPAPALATRGAVDILVDDEAQAVAAAKRYLGYFQGRLADWRAPDQTRLRDVIPDRRTRAYDVRAVVAALADEDSVLELRPQFALGAITALIRIEGIPMGVIANNPHQNAGAIASDEADKFARFIRLCDAHGLPVVSLCDTPGIMVGPDAEMTALVRHSARVVIAAANITVPFFTIVLRKGYGLGAMAMAGGSFHQGSFFTVAWPTAEFGGMGLEGQVRLGYRKELAAIEDPEARARRFRELVDKLYERGKAANFAPFLNVDDVIDPADSRRWILAGLETLGPRRAQTLAKHQAGVDPW